MLRTHYRQPIDWTVKALEEAEIATLDRWYDSAQSTPNRLERSIAPAVLDALSDDLNTPAALTELHRTALVIAKSELAHSAFAQIMGFSMPSMGLATGAVRQLAERNFGRFLSAGTR